MNVAVRNRELEAYTEGLAASGHPELSVEVADRALVPQGEGFLQYVIAYLQQSGTRIRSGETLRYGYWMTKFLGDDRLLRVWEHNREATDFVPGANLALTYWREQHRICGHFGGSFTPPRPDQLVVISEGVFEGDPVEGVRYPSPAHMSGWWITTDRYNGRPESLRTEHCYHLTAARPDLAGYLALPYGFRFNIAVAEGAWYDTAVAKEPAQ